MSGTKIGAAKMVKTVRERFGNDFWKQIGSLGGQASNTGGFQKGADATRQAGRLGGRNSSRKGVRNVQSS